MNLELNKVEKRHRHFIYLFIYSCFAKVKGRGPERIDRRRRQTLPAEWDHGLSHRARGGKVESHGRDVFGDFGPVTVSGSMLRRGLSRPIGLVRRLCDAAGGGVSTTAGDRRPFQFRRAKYIKAIVCAGAGGGGGGRGAAGLGARAARGPARAPPRLPARVAHGALQPAM